MAVLDSCCFKFSTKTGSIIIGAILFIFSVIFLFVSPKTQINFFTPTLRGGQSLLYGEYYLDGL